MSALFVVKLVLFDLDGTLVHSAPDLATAANRMLRELGRPEQPEERIAGWIGNGMARLVKRALTGEWDGEPATDLFERGLASFKTHYAANLSARTRPFPGVDETLAVLSSAGFILGCATNKAAEFTEPLLVQLDLAKYFAVIVAGDTVAARKPDPAPLLYACRQAGIAPARAALVGDSANDIRGARAAGMHAIAVTYGYNQGRDVRELQPDLVVDSAAELPQYLRLHTTD